MFKTIIIEDETLAANRLEKMISRQADAFEVMAKLPSVKAAVLWLQQHPAPDLIFMDIHLEDGLSFTIFDKVVITSPIVFTTAFEDFFPDNYKANLFAYLPKPVNQEELAAVLERFRAG